MMTNVLAVDSRPPLIWRLFNKLNNPFMKALLRSPLHGVVSRSFMVITFTGRKSGREYSTPVQYALRGNMVYLVTSQGYTWWKNLRGGADVCVHVRGRSLRGHAVTATDPQIIDSLLSQIYPAMSAAQRARFSSGKVAIIITLADGEVRS
jgi:deazaflavin-dependent oxidoreductase (nitroreductase family)